MKQSSLHTIILLFSLFAASCTETKNDVGDVQNQDTACSYSRDTTYYLQFGKDTSTSDFYALLDFVERQGEFSRFDKMQRIDSATTDTIMLQRVLCEEKSFDSPMENWVLKDVFSIRYNLTATRSLDGTNEYFSKLNLVQCNFLNPEDKLKALSKITAIGWGKPLVKWNYNYIIMSKTRIYILETYSSLFSETLNKYGHLLEKEWAEKMFY